MNEADRNRVVERHFIRHGCRAGAGTTAGREIDDLRRHGHPSRRAIRPRLEESGCSLILPRSV